MSKAAKFVLENPEDPKWRSSQLKFENLPPNVQGFIREKLETPPDKFSILVPSLRSSVIDLVYHSRTPSICTDETSYKDHKFFSPSMVTEEALEAIQDVTLPSRAIVAMLNGEAKQKWMDGAESICVRGPEGTFVYLPIWILHYWLHVHVFVHPLQAEWRRGLKWLNKTDFLPFTEQIKATIEALGTLSWSGSITTPGVSRELCIPKKTLLAYLSHDWFSDEHVDQMVYLLEHEIDKTFIESKIKLIDTILAREIIKAYSNRSKEPYNINGTTSMHQFGRSLSETNRLGGVFHVHGNHWTALTIDLQLEELAYGDPASSKPLTESEPMLNNALRWFLSQHVSALKSLDQLDEVTLSTPTQNLSRDSWNCGMYSFNALSHAFLKACPLLDNAGSNATPGDLLRLDILRQLIASFNNVNNPNVDQASEVQADVTMYFSAFQKPTLEPISKSGTILPIKRLSSLAFDETLLDKLILPKAKAPKLGTASTSSAKKRPKQLTEATILAIQNRQDADQRAADKADGKGLTVRNDFSFSSPCIVSVQHSPISSLGRPRIGILDILTVEVLVEGSESKGRGSVRIHRCIGNGCNKLQKPRTLARVLAHAKNCLFIPQDLRQLASKHSSESAPGAIVARHHKESKQLGPTSSPTSSSSAISTPISTPTRTQFNFGAPGRRALHNSIDHAIVKFICVSRTPPAIVDLPEWKEMFTLQTPSYVPASRTTLMDSHIMSEQEHVRQLDLAFLKTHKRVSISFDGGSLRSGDSLYTVHATPEGGKPILIIGRDATGVSHTGEYLAGIVKEGIHLVGAEIVIAVSSDSAANTKLARQIITLDEFPWILDLPDPVHHLSLTAKDIGHLPFFKSVIKKLRGVIKHFKQSGQSRTLLKTLRIEKKLGPGLESIGKTRFCTLTWSGVSLRRCLPAIRELCTNDLIMIPKYQSLFTSNSTETLQFEIILGQFIAVTEGIAKAIECLEATATNAADIYLYWMAVLAQLKSALVSNSLPDEICGQIRNIANTRYKEFFINGPSKVHLASFYLNPCYVRSPIFKTNPNPLAFSIVLPKDSKTKVPPGITSPRTFIEVGAYLHKLLAEEVKLGANEHLVTFRGKGALLVRTYQAQFVAYAQGTFPFAVPLGPGQSPLQWWKSFENSENAGVLAAIAIKMYAAVPHSMADERTMSTVTMLNTAQRNRQSVATIVATTQVRAHYMKAVPRKLRKSAHETPILKFYELDRVLRTIDDEPATGRCDVETRGINYDDSDSESSSGGESEAERVGVKGSDGIKTSERLLLVDDDNSEVNTACDEILEVLATAPMSASSKAKKKKDKASGVVESEDKQGDEENDDTFELGSWL